MIVATKAGYEAWDRPPDFSAAAITASTETSLRRLDSDYIDLLYGLLEEVAKRRAGFIGRTPLCFGFLSGTIRRDTVFPPGDHRNGWPRAQLDNWIDG